jgi:hypothetical protein
VVLPSITADTTDPRVVASAPAATAVPSTAAEQQDGAAVEEVKMYADSQEVQGQLQVALAAAGLPGGLGQEVDTLQVVITEAETGRLLGCHEVPVDLIVGGGAM